MDPHSNPVDSDDHPHPKLVDLIGIFIAVLTLVFPLSTVFRYAPEVPSSLSTSPLTERVTRLPQGVALGAKRSQL